jgi:hypothetical protein
VLIALKHGHFWGNPKLVQNALQELISEKLGITVHQKPASDGIENHTPQRPLLIFGIADNSIHIMRRTPGSPAFP